MLQETIIYSLVPVFSLSKKITALVSQNPAMTTCLISAFFQGASAAQAIAADDLVKQCPSVVPEVICQPDSATMQEQIEKGAVSSTSGEGIETSGKRAMLRLHVTKYNIQVYSRVLLFFFLVHYEIKYRPSSYFLHIMVVLLNFVVLRIDQFRLHVCSLSLLYIALLH